MTRREPEAATTVAEPDPLAKEVERLATEVAALRRDVTSLTARLDRAMTAMLKQMREIGDQLEAIAEDKL